jgi:hypothetical protein
VLSSRAGVGETQRSVVSEAPWVFVIPLGHRTLGHGHYLVGAMRTHAKHEDSCLSHARAAPVTGRCHARGRHVAEGDSPAPALWSRMRETVQHHVDENKSNKAQHSSSEQNWQGSDVGLGAPGTDMGQ